MTSEAVSRSLLESWNAKTEEEKLNPVLIMDKFRVRLCLTEYIPIIRDICSPGEVILIDLPPKNIKTENTESMDVSTMSDKSDDHADSDEDDDGPLKFHFVTLESLRKKNSWTLSKGLMGSLAGVAVDYFDCSPMRTSQAMSLQPDLLDLSSINLDSSLHGLPVYIITDASDMLGTCLTGMHHTKNKMTTTHTRFLGPFDASAKSQLEQLGSRFPAQLERRSKATAVYKLLSAKSSSTMSKKTINAQMTFTFKWTSELTPSSFLTAPSSAAFATFRVAPGWMDERICYQAKTLDLARLLELVTVLSPDKAKLTWPKDEEANGRVAGEVAELIFSCKGIQRDNNERQTRFLDFTEQLWLILRNCSSMTSLVDSLRLVFEALKRCQINTILHNDNKCYLARLVRDSQSGDLLLPRLEALTPIQMLLEIGYEAIKRDLIHSLVSSSMVASEDELAGFLAPVATEDVEQKVMRLLPVHLALQTMTEVVKNLELKSHQVANMTRNILLRFCGSPVTDIANVFFETEVALVDVKPEVMKSTQAWSWVNETTYLSKGHQVAQTFAHFCMENNYKHLSDKVIDKQMINGDSNKENVAQPLADDTSMEVDGNDVNDVEKTMVRCPYVCSLTTMSFVTPRKDLRTLIS